MQKNLKKLSRWWINLDTYAFWTISVLLAFCGTVFIYFCHRVVFHQLVELTDSIFMSDGIMLSIGTLILLVFLYVFTKYEKSKEELKEINKELKKANTQLKEIALKDSLTGLYNNRDFMDDEIQRLQAIAKRNSEILVFFFMDLNKLHDINTVYSHLAGDIAIKTTANIIRSTLRKEIVVFRYGGDEFFAAIPFKNNNDLQKSIANLSNRITQAVKEAWCYCEGERIPVSITIGTKIVDAGNSIEAEIKAASEQMVKGKKSKE